MSKFFEFKNVTANAADLYIYGEIVQEKSTDFWTGETSETDVDIMGFKETLENLGDIKELNLYINSPGGDVFVASAMISMLERKKNQGTKINAYVDGVSASAASFLMCVADNIYLYKNSIVMIHKPMSWAYGNAIDMQKTIDTLDKIESGTMMPMYMSKAKVSEEEVKQLIENETWFSSSDMEKFFDVTILSEEKVAVANFGNVLIGKYKNIPSNIMKKLNVISNNQNKDYEKENIKIKLNLFNGFLINEYLKEGEKDEI